jgi:hypothetical protein
MGVGARNTSMPVMTTFGLLCMAGGVAVAAAGIKIKPFAGSGAELARPL